MAFREHSYSKEYERGAATEAQCYNQQREEKRFWLTKTAIVQRGRYERPVCDERTREADKRGHTEAQAAQQQQREPAGLRRPPRAAGVAGLASGLEAWG
jgi:hypothetical protein